MHEILTLINTYGLLGGLTAVSVFLLHGAIFLSLKTTDDLQETARAAAKKLWLPATGIAILFAIGTFIYTDFIAHLGINPGAVPLGALVSLLLVRLFLNRQREGWAFAMTCLHLVLTQITFFMILFPRVTISSTNPIFSLTIYNAAASPYALGVMTIAALTVLPVVLIAEGYTYWVFRKRLTADVKKLTY